MSKSTYFVRLRQHARTGSASDKISLVSRDFRPNFRCVKYQAKNSILSLPSGTLKRIYVGVRQDQFPDHIVYFGLRGVPLPPLHGHGARRGVSAEQRVSQLGPVPEDPE